MAKKKKVSRVRAVAGRAGTLPRYPWEKWFGSIKNGSTSLKLRRGRDFLCQPHSMAQQVRNAAYRRGLVVSLSIREDVITVERRNI